MSEAAEEAKKTAAQELVKLAFMVVAVVVLMVIQKPDSWRTLQMKIADYARNHLSAAARKTGDMSMGAELRTGHQEYTIPYLLSKVRDKASQWYDKARHV